MVTVLSETKRLLAERDVTRSPLGQLALRLASAVDKAEPKELPNLSRELRLVLAELDRGDGGLEDGIGRLLESLAEPS